MTEKTKTDILRTLIIRHEMRIDNLVFFLRDPVRLP
jgi:hypothetical protein